MQIFLTARGLVLKATFRRTRYFTSPGRVLLQIYSDTLAEGWLTFLADSGWLRDTARQRMIMRYARALTERAPPPDKETDDDRRNVFPKRHRLLRPEIGTFLIGSVRRIDYVTTVDENISSIRSLI